MGIQVYTFVLHRVGVRWWRARSFFRGLSGHRRLACERQPLVLREGPLCESGEAAMTFKSWHNFRLVTAYVVH